MSLDGSESPASAPSPSPSSSSDGDFAAFLDGELADNHSSPDELEDEGLGSQGTDNGAKSSDVDVEEDSSEEGSEDEEDESDADIGEDKAGEPINDPSVRDPPEESRLDDDSRKRRRGDDSQTPSGSDKTKCPPHPGFIWDVCIRCGEMKSTIPTNDPVKTNVGLRYIHEGLEVSEEEATRVRDSELRRVTGRKKLLLVVDLDHTVLNSARTSEVAPEERAYLSATYLGPNSVSSSKKTVGEQQGERSSLHHLVRLGMYTKLRPFAHKFLEEASKMYEMYIYTMGERVYANAMALILDPTRQLFGDRIISQTDSTKRLTKDLDVVLGAESAVVILDDTEGVWPNHKANLLLMERYHFFTSSCTQFGLRAPSYVQLHRDESESEGCLATTLRTLRAIHHEFFNGHVGQGMKRKPSSDTADVRQIIRRIRGGLLADCNIVLGSELPDHRSWKLPGELGARCSNYCDPFTTHVVTIDPRSDKAMWAKEHGVYLVHPKWVDAACYLWRRPPEEEYPVPDGTSATRLTKVSFSKSVSVELPGVNGGDKGEVVAAAVVHANGSSGV